MGTSSLRRKCQLLQKRPDLIIKDLRGNVNTRLAKLDAGEYDAIVLACAGLIRLNMQDRIAQEIPSEVLLPAVGQGAVGIETLDNAPEIEALLAPLNCPETSVRVRAERAMNATLQGGCQVPIGGYAILEGDEIHLKGLVGAIDGTKTIVAKTKGRQQDAEALGVGVAKDLLAQGAQAILQEIY